MTNLQIIGGEQGQTQGIYRKETTVSFGERPHMNHKTYLDD
jgi:hypothetical protein